MTFSEVPFTINGFKPNGKLVVLLMITSTSVPSTEAVVGLKLTFTFAGTSSVEKVVSSENPKNVLYVKLYDTLLGVHTFFLFSPNLIKNSDV